MPRDGLRQALTELACASREQLIDRWRQLHKGEPPRYASMELMRRAAAYAAQEREFGGLPAAARRELAAIAKGEQPSRSNGKIRIKPGARLLREWHGTTHEVIVTDKGLVWEGTTYRSLSAVAQAISGAKWNGHRFFGLSKRRGGKDG